MDILVWFLRFFSILLGLVCVFVALDMLYIWGVEGSGRHRPHPHPPKYGNVKHQHPFSVATQHRPTLPLYGKGREPGIRPSPDTWIWWEWQLRHPAIYLLLLGIALATCGIFLWLPFYGNILWISERIEGINVLLIGLIFLRGTVKVSSPILWKKITIIKWPLSGKARPSLLWMAVGFVVTLIGLYGITCDFTSPGVCIGDRSSAVLDLVFTFLEFILGGIAAVGLEDMIESFRDKSKPATSSIQIFAVGLILFLVILILKVVLAS